MASNTINICLHDYISVKRSIFARSKCSTPVFEPFICETCRGANRLDTPHTMEESTPELSVLDILANGLVAREISRFFDVLTLGKAAQVSKDFRQGIDTNSRLCGIKKLTFKELEALAKGDEILPAPEEMKGTLKILDLSSYRLCASSARSGEEHPPSPPLPPAGAAVPRIRRRGDAGVELAALAAESEASAGAKATAPPCLGVPPLEAREHPVAKPPSLASPIASPFGTPCRSTRSAASSASSSIRSIYSTGRRRGHLASEDHDSSSTGASALGGPCKWVDDASRCQTLCKGLKKLRINKLVPAKVVESFVISTTAFSSIELLDFGEVEKVDDALISKIACPCDSLKAIQLSKCYRVTDASLLHLAKACPKSLERLLLAGCPKITDEGLAAVCNKITSLKTLAIAPRMGGITAEGIASSIFGPFISQFKGAEDTEHNEKLAKRREQWTLRQLLLQEARFEDDAAGWTRLLEALWAYHRCPLPLDHRGELSAMEPFVLRLASPFGLSDAIIEAFAINAAQSLSSAPAAGSKLLLRPVRIEIAGEHILSPGAITLLQNLFSGN
jgi:hypothetical protein